MNVRELMTGHGNVRVVAVAEQSEDITRVAVALVDLGVEVEVAELLRREHDQPWNHFGQDPVDAEE